MSETTQQGKDAPGSSGCQATNLEARVPPPLNAHDYDPPIHRLPPEILVEIVRHYIQRDTTLRDLVRLTHVCQRWSIIVQDAPVLWTTINAADGPSAFHKAMQTAKDALLDLTFDDTTAKVSLEIFLKSVGERIGQWRTLVVKQRGPAEWGLIIEALQKGTPPNLEALDLSGGGNMVSLFGGNPAPPRLKEISLSSISINLASLQLGGLRSLAIFYTTGISATDILNVIRGSPIIESIGLYYLESLTGVLPSHEAFSHLGAFDNPSIQLASLQLASFIHLTLDNIAMPFFKSLLSAIAAPRLDTLEISCELENVSDAQLFLEGLRCQLPTLARLTTDAQDIKFRLLAYAYQIVIGRLDVRLRMHELPVNSLEETWDWVYNHLGRPLKDLPAHLDVNDWEPAVPSLLEWLTHRLAVTKLSLYNDPYYGRRVLDPIIPLFSRPTTSTPATWLFPQVEILETNLVQSNGNDDLVEMIKNRHSAEDGRYGIAAPKPFREIWLAFGDPLSPDSPDPMNVEFLKEVQTVANGADVYWEEKKMAWSR